MGIIKPNVFPATIICPDDLIATVAALTLAIRVIGGSIGYCVYYNVFYNKFVNNAIAIVGDACVAAGIYSLDNITAVITLTGAGLLDDMKMYPPLGTNETAFNLVVAAGQQAYAQSYVYVYYVSIAFGAISIIAACFLGDITEFMDDHVAVVIH